MVPALISSPQSSLQTLNPQKGYIAKLDRCNIIDAYGATGVLFMSIETVGAGNVSNLKYILNSIFCTRPNGSCTTESE